MFDCLNFMVITTFTFRKKAPPVSHCFTMKFTENNPIRHRIANSNDIAELGRLNYQLIRDEGHRNPMTETQLSNRMDGWMTDGYSASIFEDRARTVAYALYREDTDGIYLRQFFVEAESRRLGVGKSCMKILCDKVWPPNKRLTVDVLVGNTTATSFWRAIGFTDYCLTLERQPPETPFNNE